ncbi:uncharacterized protein LOC112894384 isoform X1 [Panicum hallii]|uniref:uncharacterized protein LOC112894384 isoform X1 n=1 Tax=Panicum hallii TaxID=206008 RepID=UPI000DF4D9CE|nr:uncharacterized protein LOC112894384 isoform X1 [Panicum hallii]XP_025817861.1 uncharacterized protein LOC112894384 isoform X1 [Panicum hallii]
MASFHEEKRAAPQREEAPSRSKYGGISPKKPLISKDHERAYFDSADWVLGKVTSGTDQPANTAAEIHAILCFRCSQVTTVNHPLPVCFVQQGASSSNGATVPAAEPLKPKLQRTAYHQLPPRRPACTSE